MTNTDRMPPDLHRQVQRRGTPTGSTPFGHCRLSTLFGRNTTTIKEVQQCTRRNDAVHHEVHHRSYTVRCRTTPVTSGQFCNKPSVRWLIGQHIPDVFYSSIPTRVPVLTVLSMFATDSVPVQRCTFSSIRYRTSSIHRSWPPDLHGVGNPVTSVHCRSTAGPPSSTLVHPVVHCCPWLTDVQQVGFGEVGT